MIGDRARGWASVGNETANNREWLGNIADALADGGSMGFDLIGLGQVRQREKGHGKRVSDRHVSPLLLKGFAISRDITYPLTQVRMIVHIVNVRLAFPKKRIGVEKWKLESYPRLNRTGNKWISEQCCCQSPL
jgi:hypothetical protein